MRIFERAFGSDGKKSDKREISTTDVASSWFRNQSMRSGPNSHQDFNLFEIPQYSLDSWVENVSSDPRIAQCTILRIKDLGNVVQTLYDVLKDKYGLNSSEAVDIFNEYLGAACPECFGGLTGELLQTIESSKHTKGTIFLEGDSGLQRILDGICATCSSQKYYVVWHGDR